MTGEFTIELKGLQFFSYHGLYREEKKVGGEFVVDVWVKFHSPQSIISRMEETVNYATLYELIKEEMAQSKDLLETVVQTISENIHRHFFSITEIYIRIEKKNPPIINFPGSVAITFERKF